MLHDGEPRTLTTDTCLADATSRNISTYLLNLSNLQTVDHNLPHELHGRLKVCEQPELLRRLPYKHLEPTDCGTTRSCRILQNGGRQCHALTGAAVIHRTSPTWHLTNEGNDFLQKS